MSVAFPVLTPPELPGMVCDLWHDSFNGAAAANISPGCSQSALDTICVHGAVPCESGRVAVTCRACLAFLEAAEGQLQY